MRYETAFDDHHALSVYTHHTLFRLGDSTLQRADTGVQTAAGPTTVNGVSYQRAVVGVLSPDDYVSRFILAYDAGLVGVETGGQMYGLVQ